MGSEMCIRDRESTPKDQSTEANFYGIPQVVSIPKPAPLACRYFSLEIAQEPTYRWVAGRLLSLASSMIAQPARSVPSLALRRAGLPSCASQQKSDGHQLPCGGPLPEHGTTTLTYLAPKEKKGYAASVPEGA